MNLNELDEAVRVIYDLCQAIEENRRFNWRERHIYQAAKVYLLKVPIMPDCLSEALNSGDGVYRP